MAKKQIIPTSESIRNVYIQELQKRRTDAELFASISEVELVAFIRKYESTTFSSIYECLDHNFYDRVRDRIATNREMAAMDEEAELMYSIHLKTYSQFLESKAFKNLFKRKINIEENGKMSKSKPEAQTLKFRNESEGERKHITKEMDVIRRNPQLRQQCIDRYGYQCQCCGMDFAEMYGEALGANFIEVHHLKPISTFETEGIPKDFVENLVPLCSNCHSMIHHIEQSEHPLRELREAYKGAKKELKILKED
jgi:predicted HNH restriction endonuclease